MRLTRLLSCCVILTSCLAVSAQADVPTEMNVQGQLTDSLDVPYPGGVWKFVFSIWDAASGGTQLWPGDAIETHFLTINDRGLWNARIGTTVPITETVFADSARWLQITVTTGSGDVTLPRVKLNTGPFTFRAAWSQTADTAYAVAGLGPGPYLPLAGGTMSGAITSTGDPNITMGKGNFGSGNANPGVGAFVAGNGSTASGNYSAVTGGTDNLASGEGSTVGGVSDTASTSYATIAGGQINVAYGFGAAIGGGQNNRANQYSSVSGGISNTASGLQSVVGGGQNNRARGEFSVVAGGGGSSDADSNSAVGNWSAIGGGNANKALDIYTTVSGGQYNTATNWNATVGGGYFNTANGLMATVGGGSSNSAIGDYATVAGGVANDALTFATSVGGGNDNDATASAATVAGGQYNKATAYYSAIGGGGSNEAHAIYATVAGGFTNHADSAYSTIGGGSENIAAYEHVTVGGGFHNHAYSLRSTIGGGSSNVISSGEAATIGGGAAHWVSGDAATIAGGAFDTANGQYAAVGGGYYNAASGVSATVPGGQENQAAGDFSFAAGLQAKAAHNGSFVWADNTGSEFSSQSTDEFAVRATNGVRTVANSTSYGCYFLNNGNGDGIRSYTSSSLGNDWASVYAYNFGTSPAVYGYTAGTTAAYFAGDVTVTGFINKLGGGFHIDHPLDPQNKYLNHSFVESPDMKNVYDGVITLGAGGVAWVDLPEWFEALNRDFRYQLTCIGDYAPVYIASKIASNRFEIAGGKPGMEVSWQVTGIRQDASAERRRLAVEENKPIAERGKYLDPISFGLPKSAGIGAGKRDEDRWPGVSDR